MTPEALCLKNTIITPTLIKIGVYCGSAVNLGLGTCARESALGKYRVQINGPALGIYQMEPFTHDDLWANFLAYRPLLSAKILKLGSRDSNTLKGNDAYATAMMRVKYLTVAAPLPPKDDISAMAAYWKQYYNTPLGKGRASDFIRDYQLYVGFD